MKKLLLLLLILSYTISASTIKETQQAILSASTSSQRSILTSKLAEMYEKRLNRSRYRKAKEANGRVLKKIQKLYLDSLDPTTKTVQLSKYKELLQFSRSKDNYIDEFRPTLYDFLAYRALKFFEKKYYKEYYYNRDITSFYNISLDIYDKLMELHQEEQNLQALTHVEIERLKYIYKRDTLNRVERKNRDKKYANGLKELEAREKNGEVLFELAKFYNSKDDSEQKALDYAKRALNSSSEYVKISAQNLINSILSESLTFEIESVNLPHENILAKIGYKNIKYLHIKVIKIDDKIIEKIDSLKRKERFDYLKTLPILKTLDFVPPKTSDYKIHYTEISLDRYEIGRYLFILSSSKDFTSKNLYQIATISHLSYLTKDDNKILVLDRKNGNPIANVKAKLFIREYDANDENFTEETLSLVGDEEGYITLPLATKRRDRATIRLKKDNDILDMRTANLFYLNDNEQKMISKNNSLLLFTDRAIYRPLQRVHFKGIIAKTFNDKAPKVIEGREVKVYFYNANRQKIAQRTLYSDEFGSFFGSFNIPATGKLGRFEIRTNINGSRSRYIRVEEYKRPKFTIVFNPLERSYHLDERVTITGVAKSYMGEPLKNAKVRYKVIRTPSYKELYSGVGTTDKRGKFTISFQALRGENKRYEYYTYRINTEITDVTGETHTKEKSVTLGDSDFKIALKGKDIFYKDEDDSINIESLGVNGKFKAVQAEIKIEKYQRDKRVYRERYWWQKIDKPLYSKEEFEQLFPSYRYTQKDKLAKEEILSYPINTKDSRNISLKGLEQGVYLVSLKAQNTTIQKKITIQDTTQKEPPMVTPLWHYTDKKIYEKDEQVELILQSSLPPSSPIFFILKQDNKTIYEKWIDSDSTKEFIDLKQAHQGELFYHLTFVNDNRFYQYQGEITIPWDDKLHIEYITFRDKLKPNQQEQIKIRVSTKDKKYPLSQMVATIYDASLDSFVIHNFKNSSLYHTQKYSYSDFSQKTFNSLSSYWDWQKKSHSVYLDFPLLKGASRYFESESEEEDYQEYIVAPIMNITDRDRLNNMLSPDGKGGDIGPVEFLDEPIAITSPIRKDLNETMIFSPNIQSDDNGNMVLDFKTNGALTRWNFLAFIHTKDLKTAVIKKSFITQKELMVVSNLPRFFREKDKIKLTEKIVNMSDKNIQGECEMKLVNPITKKLIFTQSFKKTFSIERNSSTSVTFDFTIPNDMNLSAIEHTFIAKTSTHTDAEQMIIPVLSHRTLITKSKILQIKAQDSRDFTFEALQNSHSNSIKNHKLTFEFNSNPIWYAIRSMPYLMEYEHECSEQLFARYSANALALQLIKNYPEIEAIFKSWGDKGKLKSALQSNPKLKSILLEETPWVLEAKSQEEQLKRLGLLFDIKKMAKEQQKALDKLAKRQLKNGGFSWYGGGYADWYMTQYIVEGFGHLKKRGILIKNQKMIHRAVNALDKQVELQYKKKRALNSMLIHYLYSRSFFANYPTSTSVDKAINHYLQKAKKQWRGEPLYEQALIAMALYQNGEDALEIVDSLREEAVIDNLGMYFEYPMGYRWNMLPIESQALMIEVFRDIAHDEESVKLLKMWLLQHRQSNHWHSTKATSSAIYALLDESNNIIDNQRVQVQFDKNIAYTNSDEDETGYFKIEFNEFNSSMAKFNLTNPNSNMAFGAIYWQYFEDINRVKSDKRTPIKITKQLIPFSPNTPIRVGDKIKIRITINVDRDMKYIMIKDSRASTFEPIDVLSGYHYKKGLGYYQSTKDSATYFFFDRVRRGRYQLEYNVFVTHRGEFMDGVATIESMYAPEFKGHSRGGRFEVE